MEKSKRSGSAAPNTLEERKQEAGEKTPGHGIEQKAEGNRSEKATGKAAERKAAHMKHKAARARSRLEELAFCTFNVRTAAVNGVNGIGHIDTLLRPCAAKGCGVVRLQATKRDEISEIVASGYRGSFSGDCSRVKGREWQHGVELAKKQEIVKKAPEDGIAIECISASLLKALILITSNFVTFALAYALTEEAPEGQKVKYMAALNCTIASAPARGNIFILNRREHQGRGER